MLRREWLSDFPKKCILHINQARDRMSLGGPNIPGIVAPGGWHRKHANSVLVECRSTKTENKIIQRHGIKMPIDVSVGIKFRVLKNKVGGPAPTSGETIYFTRSYEDKKLNIKRHAGTFNNGDVLLDYGIFHGPIDKQGNTHMFNGTRLGTSRGEVITSILSDEILYQEIFTDVLRLMKKSDLDARLLGATDEKATDEPVKSTSKKKFAHRRSNVSSSSK